MIQIRNNMFETNSSSTDVFFISKSNALKIPKEIKMSKLISRVYLDDHGCIEDKLAYMYSLAEDNGTELRYLQYLASKGINVINDISNDYNFDDYMFGDYIEENDLDRFLFDPDSKLIYNPISDEGYEQLSNDYDIVKFRR